MTINKKLVGLAVAASVLLGLGGSEALAGEITGNGKALKNEDGTLNGASICAFSGLDDPDEDEFGGTQNWGSIPKEIGTSLPPLANTPVTPASPVVATRP